MSFWKVGKKGAGLAAVFSRLKINSCRVILKRGPEELIP
jgi:hypothetical protein